MIIQVIGCHGSVEPGYATTCYQINQRFFVDAGSLASAMSPAEQSKVTDVLLTHPHLDHIKDLAFLIENTADSTRPTLNIHSTDEIINDVHKHIFNDVIWPDFSKFIIHSDKKTPLLKFHRIQIGKKLQLEGVTIEPFPVNHPGNAIGYVLDDGTAQVIMTGDTGPCNSVWDKANACDRLKAIFTEISFPSRMDDLARASGHYTLTQLKLDTQKLKKKDIPIYISHFKPKFMRELMDEFYQSAPSEFHLMHERDVFEFS